MEKLGTFDFYFDVADKLKELGVEFVVMVRPPGVKSILNYSHVTDPLVAEKMEESLRMGFDATFGPPGDEDGDDGLNPSP